MTRAGRAVVLICFPSVSDRLAGWATEEECRPTRPPSKDEFSRRRPLDSPPNGRRPTTSRARGHRHGGVKRRGEPEDRGLQALAWWGGPLSGVAEGPASTERGCWIEPPFGRMLVWANTVGRPLRLWNRQNRVAFRESAVADAQ